MATPPTTSSTTCTASSGAYVTVVPKVEQQTPMKTLIRYKDIDLTKVIVKVRFTTANGLRWEATTDGAATGETVRV